MGSNHSTPILATGDTQVSTGRQCDCCDRFISSIQWYQCWNCRVFDICATTTTTQSCYEKYFDAKSTNPDRNAKLKKLAKLSKCPGLREGEAKPSGAPAFTVPGLDHSMYPVNWGGQHINNKGISLAQTNRFDQLQAGASVVDERDVWIIANHLVNDANLARAKEPKQPKQQAKAQSKQAEQQIQNVSLKDMIASGSFNNPIVAPMNHTMDAIPVQHQPGEPRTNEDQLDFLARQLLDYTIKSGVNKPRILTLDGGGVRGYLTLRCIDHIIQHGNDAARDYKSFMSKFGYIAGTSTGGLLAFSLATGIMEQVVPLYKKPDQLFGTARDDWAHLDPKGVRASKYDGVIIHNKIRELLDGLYAKYGQTGGRQWNTRQVDDGKGGKVSKGDPTFGDYRKARKDLGWPHLMLTAHDITNNLFIMANTVEDEHDDRLLYDMLCSTMAAQTYFPPYYSAEQDATFTDGGTGANDPELCGLHMARADHKNQQCQYYIMSLGTGIATQCVQSDDAKKNKQSTPIASPPAGGYINGGLWNWLLKPISGLLVTTFMDANRSFTAQISESLAQFSYIKRLRLNFSLNTAPLDDVHFADNLDKVWDKPADSTHPAIAQSNDLKAAVRFYNMYVDPPQAAATSTN